MNNIPEGVATNGKTGKTKTILSEKMFLQSILTSVITIIVCIACLTAATWAWCTDDINSSGNVFEAAYYDPDVIVVEVDGSRITLQPSSDQLENGYFVYNFVSNKEYNVTLSATGTASSCHCVVSINGVDYYTDTIAVSAVDENGVSTNPYVFTIKVPENTTVKFDMRWGERKEAVSINNNDTLDLTSEIAEEESTEVSSTESAEESVEESIEESSEEGSETN